MINFYKAPVKFTRSYDSDDESPDGAPGPIRDLVADKGPMAGKNKNKSVDFGGKSGGIVSEKTQETNTKLLELADIEIDLGNDKFNKVVSDIRFVRERLLKKVVSPDEEKSQKSKKNKRKSKFPGGATNTSGGFGSINDS